MAEMEEHTMDTGTQAENAIVDVEMQDHEPSVDVNANVNANTESIQPTETAIPTQTNTVETHTVTEQQVDSTADVEMKDSESITPTTTESVKKEVPEEMTDGAILDELANADTTATTEIKDEKDVPASSAVEDNDDENENDDDDAEDDDLDLDDVINDAINAIESTEDEDEQEQKPNAKVTKATKKAKRGPGRPKRNNNTINYKEKQQIIGSAPPKVDGRKGPKGRRGKSQGSDSSSPAPSSSSSANLKNGPFFDVEEVVPINYQPPITPETDFNEHIDLKTAKIDAAELTLTLKNGTTIKKGDCIYMVCEPPTEPFYIAQVLGFTKKDKTATVRKATNYNFSVCWFYRPRDLNRRLTDTRLVYASLHRDNCPITSFRGFATVKHKYEISDIESYKQQPDSFYFDKLYDRYMIKMYDMIPTVKLVHLPINYYKALHKRFEYIFVEVGKADELLSSPKNCEKCLQWSSNSDSISCSGCSKSYHLLCLDPPILTKPKRGFAWYCAACNKELEDKLAENRGKMLESAQPSMIMKHENRLAMMKEREENDDTEEEEENNATSSEEADSSSLRYEQLAKKFLEEDKNITLRKRREMEEWPYRYLGVHAKFEDALDLQDRPYARAASRLGSKYQCTSLTDWYDHPVQYYDTNDKASSSGTSKKLKRYYNRSKKSATPINAEEDAHLATRKFPIPEEFKDTKPRDFPGWLQSKPKGYIERGGDDTSTLLWKMPNTRDGEEFEEAGNMIEQYIRDCAPVAKRLKLATVTTPNFIDAILLILMRHDYKPEECMEDVNKLTRESLKEPTFTPEEIKRFEDSVRINGSELYPVFKDVKTQTSAMVVRFYYLWKKTKNGHEIWDNFSGRAKNRLKSTTDVGIDLDNPDDDGIYSNAKINKSSVKLKCMYCETGHSPEWFRAPGAVTDEANKICEGLCFRCAKLWRKYATKWENPLELIKNQEKKAGYSVKKKTELALIQEAELVVKARENYKLHPRPISKGLKKYKTVDTDYDYNNDIGVDKPKKRGPKKKTVKASSSQSTDATATSTASIVASATSATIATDPDATKPKKEKAKTVKKPGKRTAKELEEKSEADPEATDGVPKKKRKYTKRKPVDKSLRFVYGKVVDNDGKRTFTSKRKECPSDDDPAKLAQYEKAVALIPEMESLNAQIEENNASTSFNAFLDMKLREKLETLEKELQSLDVETVVDSEGKLSVAPPPSPLPAQQEPLKPDSSHDISMDAESSPTLDSQNEAVPFSQEYDHGSNKKYVRRRLYLSKKAVPGSGVFETPPIQLPGDNAMPDASPPMSAHSAPVSAGSNYVFQMFEQSPEMPMELLSSDFQSQPNMLPSDKPSAGFNEFLSSSQSTFAPSPKVKALAKQSRKQKSTKKKQIAPSTELAFPHEEVMEPSSDIIEISSSSKTAANNTNATSTTMMVSSSKPVNKTTSASFLLPISNKGKDFIKLVTPTKAKMLTPIIDSNDTVTKDMIGRYASKFDVYSPLTSEEGTIGPIMQMKQSSRELQLLWRAYQSSRRSKGRSSKSFQQLYPSNARACCVCRELGDTRKMLICSNCGLNVHASCYGLKLDPSMEKDAAEHNWHCDPCSNDLHVNVSTQYVCLLCNSRESNMDAAIKGDPVAIPDALKRTAEGRWCHVTCSLLCDQIKYGSDAMQPVHGTHVVGMKNLFSTCKVCLSMGGAVVKCPLCSNRTHVTCGLDFNWKVGFKLAKIFDFAAGDVVEIAETGATGKLVPVFYCDKHLDIEGMYKLTDLGRKINVKDSPQETLMELFVSDERKQVQKNNNGLLRRENYEKLAFEFDNLAYKTNTRSERESPFEGQADNRINAVMKPHSSFSDVVMNGQHKSHRCSYCSAVTSLCWYPNSSGDGEMCHICYKKPSSTEDVVPAGPTIPDLSNVDTKTYDYSIYGC